MSEAVMTETRQYKLHYRGRGGQIVIYLGKLLRGFIYQADWKVLPMAALIAGVVSMVVHRNFFITMEGTLMGALALTCTSIWNGFFNSIQVVCREREIIKREHRSGMHVSAYICAHMIYQALLCMMQTVITLFVCRQTGIQFPEKGLFTPWLIVDLGITVFLITFAADMLSLWISCLCHSTTTAMTIMPFVLIFQLVFSGGIFSLPAWADKMAVLSISNYGMKCLAAQSDYNGRTLVTGWDSLNKVRNQEINATVTLGEALDFLTDDSRTLVHDMREKTVVIPTIDDFLAFLERVGSSSAAEGGQSQSLMDLIKQFKLPETQTGERETVKLSTVIDALAEDPEVQKQRDLSYSVSITIGEIINTIGEDKVKTAVEEQTTAASRVAAYENTPENIFDYWVHIVMFAAVFSVLAVIFLEFIDKDKR